MNMWWDGGSSESVNKRCRLDEEANGIDCVMQDIEVVFGMWRKFVISRPSVRWVNRVEEYVCGREWLD